MATLAERLAAAEARAKDAEARVSDPSFIAEEQTRKKLAEAEDRERSARERERDMLVARALDDAPEGAEAVIIEAPLPMPALKDAPPSSPVYHFFTVQAAGSTAYRAMQEGMRNAQAEKLARGTRHKVSFDEVYQAYAVAGIIGWYADGKPLDLDDSENGKRLNDFLRANPAVVTQVSDRIARLDGAASEARKR
jgi:hypothetical protein